MAKSIGSLQDELGNAAQAIARAKLTPEAGPYMRNLDQLLQQITVIAQHGNLGGGPGGAPMGGPPGAGAPPGQPGGAPPGPPPGQPRPGGYPAAPGQGMFPQSPIPNANELAALVGNRAGM